MTNSQKIDTFSELFRQLSTEQKTDYLKSLSEAEKIQLYKNPDNFLFDKQIIGDGKWVYYLLRCGRGFGKDIDITTPVPTPNGWKTMADLQVGDQVFGEDGKPTTITWVSPIFHNPCYQLTFSTGETVIAGQDHQWLTHTHANRKSAGRSINPSQPTVKTTKELFETQRYLEHESNHSIIVSKSLQYSTKQLPIDPYVLGCWLGDGQSNTGAIECADQQILDEIGKVYSVNLTISSVGKSKSSRYRIGNLLDQMLNGTPHKIGELTKLLQENNLINNKHIPAIYLHSNIEQRMSLLQGLMDTDGSCDKRGVLEFRNTNKLLTEQTYELILSLGIKATMHQNESWLYDKRCADRYRIYSQTDKPVFRLDRKRSNQRTPQNDCCRYITKIERVPTVPTKCISVDNASHLYLITKSCIPTHNSHAGAAWVAKKIRQGAKKIGLCGPTYSDVSDTMVPMILSWFLPEEFADPSHPYTDYKIKFKNGAQIHCYSSEVEKKGPNLEYLWCDEIATWCQGQPDKIKERFDDITRAVRKGKHPQTIITSTPKNHPFFTWFQKNIDGYNQNFKLVQGSMLENPTLSQAYKDNQIALYAHNSKGRQELFGDLITDTEGAFWNHKEIDDLRAPLPSPLIITARKSAVPTNAQLMGLEPMPTPIDKSIPHLTRMGIGFDPSGSVDGDECGILAVALYSNQHAYVIEDASGSYNPNDYAIKLDQLYRKYPCSFVMVESNFGGKESFLYILRSVNATMNVKTIHSKTGKATRAEHISGLYAQGRVHHVGSFKYLEDQMTTFNVHYSKSPDRLDALGFVLTELFWPQNAAPLITARNLPAQY
jgi:phage terminase large subunit-like protein